MWKRISIFAAVLFCVSILTAAETPVNLNVGESIAERVIGQGAVFADGVLTLRGTGNVYFSKFEFDQKAGEVSFKLKHNYDTKNDPRIKNLLRNQIYLVITLPDRTNFSVYSADGYIRAGTFAATGDVVVLTGAAVDMVKDDWMDVTIGWGKDLTISVDGVKIAEKPFEGMFGANSGKNPATLRIGQGAGYGVENEFSVKNLQFGKPSAAAAMKDSLKDDMTLKSSKITNGGGKISGSLKVESVDGRPVAVLTKTANILYPKININNDAGEINMRLCLNFDPASGDPRVKKEWRNQMFLTMTRGDRNYATLYSCLEDFRFGVFTPGGDVLFVLGGMYKLEKGVWYDVTVKWGKKVEIIVNGKVIASKDHDGLFGKLPPGDGVISQVGYPAGFGIENEFSVANWEVKSVAGQEQITAAVPYINGAAPVIDGNLDDEFWQRCSKLDGFSQFSKRDLLRDSTTVQIGYTEQGIAVGFECNLPGGREANVTQNQRDAAMYTEDAMEMRFVDTTGGIYLFMLSPNGTKFDAYKDDVSYNPDWTAAARTEKGKWFGELLIPYAALGMKEMPKAQTSMLANFSIDINGFFSGGSWSFTEKSYNAMNSMGRLFFTGSDQGLRLTLNGLVSGQPKIEFKKIGEINPVTQLRGMIYDDKGEEVSKYNFRLSDTRTGVYTGGNLGPGLHTAVLEAKNSDGMILLAQKLYFKSEVNTRVEVKNYPYNGFAVAEANFPQQLKNQAPATIEFSLNGEGKKLCEDKQQITGKSFASGKLATSELAPGNYEVNAKLFSTKGELLDSAKAALTIFPKPVWWKTQVGLEHAVPSPWEPVTKSANGYKIWNREYCFDNTVFPRQINIGGKNWLRAAPKFTMIADGKNVELSQVKTEKVESFEDEVIFHSRDGKFTLRGKLEFDGFYKFDLTSAAPVKIDALSMEFPVTSDFTGWYLTATDIASSVYRLDKSVALGFMPYLWLGSSDAGVAVVFESDECFTSANPRAIELSQVAGGVDCKYNIVTSPKTFKQPLRLSFALMATPVRPVVTNDPFLFSRWETPAKLARPTSIVYERIAKLKPESGTLEFWFKRDRSSGATFSEFFAIAPGTRQAAQPIRCYLNDQSISLDVLRKPFISGKIEASGDDWHHFAMTYDTNYVKMFCDGKEIAAGRIPPEFIQNCKDLATGENSLYIGGFNPDVSTTALQVDEVRISDVVRDGAMPGAEFITDANTLVLDHFEENFRPDGFTGYTAGGSSPTIGTKFVAGKFGQGMQLLNEPLRDGQNARKEDMNHEIDIYWNWHNEIGYNAEYAWPPSFNYQVRPTFKADIEKSIARGSYAMAYTIFPAVGLPSQLYDQFGAEWNIVPNQIMPYEPPAGHKFSIISIGAPGYSDYIAYSVKWMLENYGLNAIYTDGMCTVNKSTNSAYGAGYVDDRGQLVPTCPFFSVRETAKRVYKIIKANDPKKIIINHQSFNLPIPVMSFSDAVFTGEHEDYSNVQTGALRFRGEPWGLYIFLLGASTHAWSEMHNMTPLLNGSAVYGFSMDGRKDMARKVKMIKDIYAANDYKNAQWYPWFKAENNILSCADGKIHAAAYVHDGKSALLLVANYNQANVNAKIKLNLDKLGMSGKKITASNELLQLPITVNGNEIVVPVLAQKFTLVKIEAK
jgi:hypothetical protein